MLSIKWHWAEMVFTRLAQKKTILHFSNCINAHWKHRERNTILHRFNYRITQKHNHSFTVWWHFTSASIYYISSYYNKIQMTLAFVLWFTNYLKRMPLKLIFCMNWINLLKPLKPCNGALNMFILHNYLTIKWFNFDSPILTTLILWRTRSS